VDTNSNSSGAQPAQPRTTAQVRFADERLFEAPLGTPLDTFVCAAYPNRTLLGVPIVAALVDGRLRELSYPLKRDANVELITMSADDGMKIYRRGLTFLLVAAALELFPDATVEVDHSIQSGGYYCMVQGRAAFTAAELETLKTHMHAMVADELPITKDVMPLADAISMFRRRGDDDKVKLLMQRTKDYLVVYHLGPLTDYFHGYMVPSTGYLKWFDLQPADAGFLIQFPQRSHPTEIKPKPEIDRLLDAFREYGAWLDKLGISNVGSLNEAIDEKRIGEVILVSEALHEQRIAQIAERAAEGKGDPRLILIAGPSSSGKTTFSKRLSIQLLAHGLRPFALAMDEYFVDRIRTPLDDKGEYDFESLYALDLERFNRDLLDLMAGKEVILPHYDFKSGASGQGDTLLLSKDTVIIAEGIHGLNPDLVPKIPSERLFRIYVSALTQVNLDRHNRVSTTDTRLIRRIVRDAATRGYDAQHTIKRWDSVRRGETERIFPFQEHADAMFNSALAYELSALRPLAEPLLLQIPADSPEYVRAKRLLALLAWFRPIPPDLIPSNSILREFVGGSTLEQFRLWGAPKTLI
jgi:uridine kinase